MAEGTAQNARTLRRWKVFLVVSGLAVLAFGVWQVALGNVGNGLGMILVPAITVTLLLILLRPR